MFSQHTDPFTGLSAIKGEHGYKGRGMLEVIMTNVTKRHNFYKTPLEIDLHCSIIGYLYTDSFFFLRPNWAQPWRALDKK